MSIRLGSSVVDYSMIETILEYNTISKETKVDGILSVELMNFISEDTEVT